MNCDSVYSIDGFIAGADVPGLYEEGSPAKMGTSTGNQIISYEYTKRSFTTGMRAVIKF